MTQDLGVPIDPETEKIYRHGIPSKIEYPGNISIIWEQVEKELYEACLDASRKAKANCEYWAICIYFLEDIYESDSDNLPFLIVGLERDEGIPLSGDLKGNENVLSEAYSSSFWSTFIMNIKKVQTKDEWPEASTYLNKQCFNGDRYWSDTLDPILKACALNALRRTRDEGAFDHLGWSCNKASMPFDTFKSPFPTLRFYVGENGETAEEWVNRSCDYSRLALRIEDERLSL